MSTTNVNTCVSTSAQSETADDIDIRGSAQSNLHILGEIKFRYNIFDIYIHSGLHVSGWPIKRRVINDVYAVVQLQLPGVKNPVLFVAENDHSHHAEENMISQLNKLMSTALPVVNTTIKIWINFSPCYKCSEKILEFIKEMRKRGIYLSIEIIFPFLYKIRRAYCVDNCSHKLPSPKDHGRNVKGLLSLKHGGGVFLKTFDAEEWRKFGEVMGIDYRVPENRKLEDERLERDFLRIIRNWTESI